MPPPSHMNRFLNFSRDIIGEHGEDGGQRFFGAENYRRCCLLPALARCPSSRDAVDDDDPSLRRWKQESRILPHHTTPPPPQTVPPTERERSKGAIKSPPPPTYVRLIEHLLRSDALEHFLYGM